MVNSLLEERVLLNSAFTNEYVPEIDRLIITIKEMHRAMMRTLLFKSSRVPRLLKVQSVLQ